MKQVLISVLMLGFLTACATFDGSSSETSASVKKDVRAELENAPLCACKKKQAAKKRSCGKKQKN